MKGQCMKRREFIKTGLAGGVLSRTGRGDAAKGGRMADARIELLLDEPIGRIAPEIYGHFVEHLGGVVYDGIWVGEDSKVPNVGGVRQAIVEAMRRIKASVIRWPGGCFADSYNWRDGGGPRKDRPRRPNFWIDGRHMPNGSTGGPWSYDPNHFGT